eukprot:scaffold270_cov207-Alexandrium_tamarense.AAC.19
MIRMYKSTFSSSFATESSSFSTASFHPNTTANILAVRAAEDARDAFFDSLPRTLLQSQNETDVPAPFKRDEIVLGSFLGSGEFSNVYEIEAFCTKGDVMNEDETRQRESMALRNKYALTGKARYALKHIKVDYQHQGSHSEALYIQATRDIAREAEILASLNHPHVIKLRGVTSSGAAGFFNGADGYFLIIDRLFGTLDQRIKLWYERKKSQRSLFLFPSRSRKSVADDKNRQLEERLAIALQIASAMMVSSFIGSPSRGDVKIFDFGLARVLPQSQDQDANMDTFKMSGAGTPRYMAPEVLISGQPYNVKVDVYSFSIVFWEMLEAKIPFGFMFSLYSCVLAFIRHVSLLVAVKKKGRPVIDHNLPPSIQTILRTGFHPNQIHRPTMHVVYNTIRDELSSLKWECGKEELRDSYIDRRRSYISIGEE